MKKKTLDITAIQTNLHWKERDKNIVHFNNLINQINNTDIILLPELFNTAFSINDNNLAEEMNGKTISWMKLKSQEKNCAISGTLLIKENNKIYNRLIWISKEGTLYTYDKYHLFSLIKEEKYITKGEKRIIIEEEGWKFCPLICYDLRFPVFSRNNIDYDVLIYLASWPVKRIDAWITLLKARSIENQCYTIGVNRIGEDGNGVLFNGNSKVFDAFGEELCSGIANQEQILQFEICQEKLQLQRRQMNFLKDRDIFTIL